MIAGLPGLALAMVGRFFTRKSQAFAGFLHNDIFRLSNIVVATVYSGRRALLFHLGRIGRTKKMGGAHIDQIEC